MQYSKFIATAVVLCCINAFAQDPVSESDEQRIQGTWQVISCYAGLKQNAADEGESYVIKDDMFRPADDPYFMRWTGSKTDECWYLRIRLDPTQTPKHITLHFWTDTLDRKTGTIIADAAVDEYALEGIYEIDDGKLRLCIATEPEKRPTTFALREGCDRLVIELTEPKNDQN